MSTNRTPLPGRPVRGSKTGRPLMAAMDLLSRRWALRIIWELRDGPLGPRPLLARCEGLSSSVLYQRLDELTTADLVAPSEAGYTLTVVGMSLAPALQELNVWADTWAETIHARPPEQPH